MKDTVQVSDTTGVAMKNNGWSTKILNNLNCPANLS